jgi:hypothetical protein
MYIGTRCREHGRISTDAAHPELRTELLGPRSDPSARLDALVPCTTAEIPCNVVGSAPGRGEIDPEGFGARDRMQDSG